MKMWTEWVYKEYMIAMDFFCGFYFGLSNVDCYN